jgi:hypothetical protein
MGRQVVHFEVIGTDPAGLRRYYAALFGWEFQVGDAVSEKVSQPGTYGYALGPDGLGPESPARVSAAGQPCSMPRRPAYTADARKDPTSPE